MGCSHEDLNDGVRIVRLSGRLDTEEINRISLPFTVAATSGSKSVVVDLSAVDFLASLGVGAIVSAARTVQNRQGRFALCGANPQVLSTLERTQIPKVIPTFREAAEARLAVQLPAS